MAQIKTQGLGIEDIIGNKREQVIRLAKAHGAYNVRVFGSVARGEATPTSDVDFLVDWDYDAMTSWGSAGLWDELQALLGRKVDVVSEKSLHWYIRDRILAEAVTL